MGRHSVQTFVGFKLGRQSKWIELQLGVMTGSINIWYPHTHYVGDIFSEMIAFEWIILQRVLYNTNSPLYSTHEYLFGVMLISGWKSAIQWSIFRSWSLFFGAFHWEGQLAGVATWYPGNPMEVVSPLIPLSYMLYQYFNLLSNPFHNTSLNGTHNMSHTICRQWKQEGLVLVQGPASQVKANLRSPRRAGQQPAWTAN